MDVDEPRQGRCLGIFFAYDGARLYAAGVKTGASGFCSWHVDPHGISLWMDVRSGGMGVKLGERTLNLAAIVERNSMPVETPYESASRFTAMLCDKPLLPKQPIYGANNFYYAYGESSHDQVLDDSRLVSDLSPNPDNRPFSIIDMGWENEKGDGSSFWRSGNERFPDMAGLAGKIKKIGARPGIWYRPPVGASRHSLLLDPGEPPEHGQPRRMHHGPDHPGGGRAHQAGCRAHD